MAQCPSCQSEIQIGSDQFGTLFQCPNCGADFFVDFNGTPENSKQPQAVIHETTHADENQNLLDVIPDGATPEQVASDDRNFLESTSDQNFDNGAQERHEEDPVESNFGLDFLSSSPSVENNSNSLDEYESSENAEPADLTLNQNLTESYNTNPPPVNHESQAIGDSQDLNEISDFGNALSEHITTLTLNIVIEDIDLPEQKTLLIETIEDSRLGLDADEIRSKLPYGKVEIQEYPVSKAVVLIHRLQGLGFSIVWSENVSTL